MNGQYIISIDQSTQGTKALLFDENYHIVKRKDILHKQITNSKGWVSHNPEEIYKNVILVVKQLLNETEINPASIKAVGISNQRETSLIWDKKSGELVDNAIVWQCSRAKNITDRISSKNTQAFIKEATGLTLSPYFPAAKFAWLFEEHNLETKMLHGELCCGTMDSYLLYRLTNKEEFKSDYSNASRTQLFNITTQEWDKEICSMFHINPDCLPEVCDSDSIFGYSDFEETFPIKIPIHAIMGDSHAALYAQTCWQEGQTKATYGTGSSIMMNTGSNMKMSSHGLATSIAWKINDVVQYVLEGNINYTGAVISWLKDDVQLIKTPSETSELAMLANNQDTSYLVPAFSGLSAPYWNSNARASLSGMTRLTGKNEIVKACLESIAYQINDVIQIMKTESGLNLTRLCVDGGPTKNTFLMQFQCDISQIPVYISNYEELSAVGVAFLAGQKIGLYKEKEILDVIKYQRIFTKMDDGIREVKLDGWKRSIEIALQSET